MSDCPWFAWYPGDYHAKTSHLTWIEDSAYRRLLDAYYDRGGLLSSDRGGLFRICSARSPEEEAAIVTVVSQFFTIQNNKLVHERADTEIAKRTKIRERLSAAGHRGGLTAGRGRPIGVAEARSQSQPQLQEAKPREALSSSHKINGVETKRVLEFLNETAGRKYRSCKVNLDLIRCRLESGITEDQLRKIIVRKCREWLPNPKMRAFLRPSTLFGATNCEQYVGELVPPKEEKYELC